MAKRCSCTAYLRTDGSCPHRCERGLTTPAWRRVRAEALAEATTRRREMESKRTYLTREESMRGALKADPSYRRDFFEASVRNRVRARRRVRSSRDAR